MDTVMGLITFQTTLASHNKAKKVAVVISTPDLSRSSIDSDRIPYHESQPIYGCKRLTNRQTKKFPDKIIAEEVQSCRIHYRRE